MKKKLGTLFASLALVATLIACLCGCSTYGGVKSAFERENWTEVESVTSAQTEIAKDLMGDDYENVCTIHVLSKNGSFLNYVIIAEFNGTKEMQEEIDQNETLKAFVRDAQTSDYVSGSCILLFYTPTGGGNTVFKSTK